MLKLKYLILSILLSLFFSEGFAKPASSPRTVTDTIIILYFSSNLGEIEVEAIDTQFLPAIVPISGGPGHYIITFTLPSGQQYQGEFDVWFKDKYYYLGDQLISTEYENQYYILCIFGQENGDRDGYYLSGIFNYHFGPAYLENYHTRSTTVTTEGTDEYYRFMMHMVTGIRRWC